MTTTATTTPPTQARQVQAQARPDIERQRQDAEQQARRTLDQDAIAAIEETRKAVQAIADGKTDEAVAAIERATGKIDVLTARNPQTALLPVDVDVVIIDTAPRDIGDIRGLTAAVDAAIIDRDFPLARVLLTALVSEIRVRTYHLPLATYPAVLREAARMLEDRKNDQARTLLETALNTLVVIDQVIPLPMVVARVAVEAAERLRDSDRDAAIRLVGVAREELDRAMELGYAGRDEEYKTLSRTISDLEKQLKGNENTGSTFARLRERMAEFFGRMSGSMKTSQGERGARRQPSPASAAGQQQQQPPQQQPAATAAPPA